MGVISVLLFILLACAGTYAAWLRRSRHGLEAQLRERASRRLHPQTLLRSSDSFRDEVELEVLRVARTGRSACLIVLRFEDDLEGDDDKREARCIDLARVLDRTVRAIDRRHRIGADEFALLLPETRARGGLVAVARLEQELLAAGVGRMTAGVAELGPGIDRQLLFRHAYCALLAAGQNGRSTVLAYSLELERRSEPDTQLAAPREIESA